jgi:cysteine synthase A
MFRTAVRRFAATALRPAETVAQMEAPQLHGIEISKAQRIAHDGFIDGTYPSAVFYSSRG